ncbi:MAG: DUF1571 domain-containing protein [Planctomycetales bacterium]
MRHTDGRSDSRPAAFRRAVLVPFLGALVAMAGPALGEEPGAAAGSTPAPQHPLVPALDHARAAREALDDAKDYQAVFSRRERVKGRLGEPQTMQVKIRHQPFSVYLKFVRPHEGREVIYVEGKNDGHLLAHETGIRALAGTVKLLPTSERAMAESRFPITMMGMRTLVDAIVSQWEQETQFGETDVKYYPNAKLGEMECYVIESSHPQPRKQFKFQLTRLYIEKTTRLPVRVEQYGFPTRAGEAPPLMEEYTYSNLRVDSGLTDVDFDPSNRNYGFD